MPWKRDEGGALATDERGDPIYVQDGDNKEAAVNYDAVTKALSTANKEAERRRLEAKELRERYKALEGEADVDAYVKAKNELAEENARLRENTDASKIEERVQAAKASIEKAWMEKERSWEVQRKGLEAAAAQEKARVEALTAEIHGQRIKAMFNESAYVKEQCALPAAVLYGLFGGKAAIGEDGGFRGLDPETNDPLLATDGKPASFDHWIHRMIAAYPEGKSLLRGAAHSTPGGAPRSAAPGGNNPWRKETWNVTKQYELMRSNFELAKQMAREAGHEIQSPRDAGPTV